MTKESIHGITEVSNLDSSTFLHFYLVGTSGKSVGSTLDSTNPKKFH